MYATSENPGKCRYKCVKCGEVIRLDEDSDTLPPCPWCNGTKWTLKHLPYNKSYVK